LNITKVANEGLLLGGRGLQKWGKNSQPKKRKGAAPAPGQDKGVSNGFSEGYKRSNENRPRGNPVRAGKKNKRRRERRKSSKSNQTP